MRYTFEINNCKTVHFGELLQLKLPNLRIFKGFCNIDLRIFVYFMEINLRIFNIIRIFALRKYLTPLDHWKKCVDIVVQ